MGPDCNILKDIVQMDSLEEPKEMLYNGSIWEKEQSIGEKECFGNVLRTVHLLIKTE